MHGAAVVLPLNERHHPPGGDALWAAHCFALDPGTLSLREDGKTDNVRIVVLVLWQRVTAIMWKADNNSKGIRTA